MDDNPSASTVILRTRYVSAHLRSVIPGCPGWVRTGIGGRGATRTVPAEARSIVLAAMLPADATGGFYRDGKRIPW